MRNIGSLPKKSLFARPYNEDDNESLEDLFALDDDDDSVHSKLEGMAPEVADRTDNYDVTKSHFSQWQVGPFGTFRPATKTVESLPAGAYTVENDKGGVYLVTHKVMSDNIVTLPDSTNTAVLASIQKFWSAKEQYRCHGLLFKRGYLLHGPPGGGKTITVTLLVRDLIDRGGIVVYCSHPRLLSVILSAIRRIEPLRPLIVVLEDIDEILKQYGEHEILSMLDGENQIDNCVFVGTTNYPDRLAGRIVNRPSRFDERIHVPMPSLVARRTYLGHAVLPAVVPDPTLDQWATDTANFGISHLRELVASVLCLEQPYDDVLKRLKAMTRRPKSDEDGFVKSSIGLMGND